MKESSLSMKIILFLTSVSLVISLALCYFNYKMNNDFTRNAEVKIAHLKEQQNAEIDELKKIIEIMKAKKK